MRPNASILTAKHESVKQRTRKENIVHVSECVTFIF